MAKSLYVFEKVLKNYSYGIAIIAADSLEETKKYIEDSFYPYYWQKDYFEEQKHEWENPIIYPLANECEPGVKHYIIGGE